ncbi:hypothetical protein EDB86DRAFT_2330827 [Lactarius hatsudake]|nr:hypothetical protein EDB86DRAFT_2330827 [Lactarius hatsudake]
MIPLVPTVALALVSLLCSAFVILRTVLSTLSPRTLQSTTPPCKPHISAQFFHSHLQQLHYSPPSSRALPPADKSYIWLALCDISALSVFVWEVFVQWSSSSSGANRDSGAISGHRHHLSPLARAYPPPNMLSHRLCSHPHPRPNAQVGFLRCRTLVTLGASRPPGHRVHTRSRHLRRYDNVSRSYIPRRLHRVLFCRRGAEYSHVWLLRRHTHLHQAQPRELPQGPVV